MKGIFKANHFIPEGRLFPSLKYIPRPLVSPISAKLLKKRKCGCLIFLSSFFSFFISHFWEQVSSQKKYEKCTDHGDNWDYVHWAFRRKCFYWTRWKKDVIKFIIKFMGIFIGFTDKIAVLVLGWCCWFCQFGYITKDYILHTHWYKRF